jgi:glucosamine--fructose-6-phosphate aminotransferase (isomerizing)
MAVGLSAAVIADVDKEVSIFAAHGATPIVVTSDAEQTFGAAAAVIRVPSVSKELDFVLASMAGHLFAYEVALASDRQAGWLRDVRLAAQDQLSTIGPTSSFTPSPELEATASKVLTALQSGRMDGGLGASVASRVQTSIMAGLGTIDAKSFERINQRPADPETVLIQLIRAMTQGEGELGRSIDTIRDQAKSVTVGTSRAEVALPGSRFMAEINMLGVNAGDFDYKGRAALAALAPIVASADGVTRYVLQHNEGQPTQIRVADQQGSSAGLRSRTEDHPVLSGTKRKAVNERRVILARGASDGRVVLMLPESKGLAVVGLTLVHLQLEPRVRVEDLKAAFQALGTWDDFVDATLEHDPGTDINAVLSAEDSTSLLLSTGKVDPPLTPGLEALL